MQKAKAQFNPHTALGLFKIVSIYAQLHLTFDAIASDQGLFSIKK